MREERLQILKMVQEGIISAEEASKLLAALGGGEERAERPVAAPLAQTRRWLRIRVTDKATGKVHVNLSLPVGLLDWGLRMAEVGGINLGVIRDLIQGGAEGKILEVEESESGERVEIFVE